MANQIETNLFEELSDADLMAVVGGALFEGGGTAGTGVSVGQTTQNTVRYVGITVEGVSNALDALVETYQGTGAPSSIVTDVTG